ncbi:hypothetical protein [Rhodovibrio sodomensis]|uniref:hypothetical protein n=1 Tax=Rhodovibrio sodomensis TaxID=1088 RepID=UPI001A929EDB|nr:hypothetical protein [Rhodovibrio sodomensis]
MQAMLPVPVDVLAADQMAAKDNARGQENSLGDATLAVLALSGVDRAMGPGRVEIIYSYPAN